MGSAREEGGRGLKSLSGPKLPFGQKTEFGKWSIFSIVDALQLTVIKGR
jgi:hypothetical protein